MASEIVGELRLLQKRFRERDVLGLKDLAEELASESFILQDPALLDLSLVAYACSKFLEKPYIVDSEEWHDFDANFMRILDQSTMVFKQGRDKDGRALVHTAIMLVESLSGALGRFVTSVIEKARIKAGAQMYAHGASLGQASALTGAEKRALAEYIGVTRMLDKYATLSVNERFANAERLFS
jgi:hypothetical protein